MENIDGSKNNSGNSSTTKLSKYIPSGVSVTTISPFRSIENKNDVYRGKDCMKKFCEFLREQAMKITNFKQKKMKFYQKSCRNHMKMQKSVIFVKKKNWK